MIRSDDKEVHDPAIEYLKMVSDPTLVKQPDPEGKGGSSGRSLFKNEHVEESELEKLCAKTSKLHGFVHSLLTLSAKQVEDISTTELVKGVLDQIIETPCGVANDPERDSVARVNKPTPNGIKAMWKGER